MKKLLLPLLVLAAALAGWHCSGSAKPKNVLLISIDTLRADHLSCYGYAKKTTPEIDALAARGVLFEHAMAPSSWTTPSHASLFTGLLSSQHGAALVGVPIHPETPTLPEYLKEAGLASAAFVTHQYVGKSLGFARKFDSFWMEEDAPADKPVDEAIQWLGANGKKPFFAFVHLFDPHMPYQPPKEYVDEYDEFCRQTGGDRGTLNFLMSDDKAVSQRALTCLLRRYDDEIRYTDRQVGRLVRYLETEKLLDKTVVIIVADHGEEFLEHQGVLHGITLYQEQLHVPLILLGAGIPRGKRIAAQVRLQDVLPTVLELEHLTPKIALQAASLTPFFDGRETADRDAIAETCDVGPNRMSIISGHYKYIYSPRAHIFMQPMEEKLFDLAADPQEKTNLLAEKPELAKKLQAALIAETGYKWRKSWKLLWGGAGSEETRRGSLSTGARFIYAFKYLGYSSFADVVQELPFKGGMHDLADYELQRSPNKLSFDAKDHGRENGVLAVVDPDDAPVTVAFACRDCLQNEAHPEDERETELSGEIDPAKPRLFENGAFRVYTEPILTFADPPPLASKQMQDVIQPDMLKKLRTLGYF
ncbi:MAG: sulfatase-like hydrolase/transferase [Myxococcales bacterium]|nr:sulfatase-like hydrolase/transferase [Myxococcales bacterium]